MRNRIRLKSKRDIEKMRRSGRSASIMLQRVGEAVRPGISTAELDQICHQTIEELGGESSFLGYQLPNHPPYPATICSSINEVIVHGIPKEDEILREGQIASIDTARDQRITL